MWRNVSVVIIVTAPKVNYLADSGLLTDCFLEEAVDGGDFVVHVVTITLIMGRSSVTLVRVRVFFLPALQGKANSYSVAGLILAAE